MALWGSKNDQQDNGDAAPSNEGDSRQSHEQEPTERTRLLQQRPPPPHNDGYLDPDDPAVGLNYRIVTLPTDEKPGLPVQPVDCPLPSIFHRFVPGHHVPLVGLVAGIDIRVAVRISLSEYQIVHANMNRCIDPGCTLGALASSISLTPP